MGFPAEGTTPYVVKRDDGLWHCIDCDYANANHQSVLGHRGKHNPNKVRPVGRPKRAIDPMDMSFSQLIDEIDSLRKRNDELTKALHKEKQRNATIRGALSAFMQG